MFGPKPFLAQHYSGANCAGSTPAASIGPCGGSVPLRVQRWRPVICSPRPNASKESGTSAGCSAKPPIEAQVIACHHVRGEPLLEHFAHYPAVKLIKLEDRPYSFVFGIHNEPGFPVFDDLGDGPAAPRDHRRSTSHGFDQHQTKRLGPIDREQESVGISKESGLFAVAYLPDEFHQRIGPQGLYLVAKIAHAHSIHLCRNLEAHAQALRDGDRPIGTLLGRDATEEGEIRIAGHLVERVNTFSETMVNSGQPVRACEWFALIIRYRDQGIVAPTRIDLRQVLQVEPTVQCGHGSRRQIFKERKMDEIDMEMQKIEFVPAQMKFMQHGKVSGQV